MSGSSVVDSVFGVLSFFLFPFVVLQIITFVVFPSFGWSSCSVFSLCRYEKPQIPLNGFSGPSVWILGGYPQGLPPFQFLLRFKPICDVVCQYFSSASFVLLFCIHTSLLSRLLGLLCCRHHRMKRCCLGRIHRMYCLFLEYHRLFRRHECLLLQVLGALLMLLTTGGHAETITGESLWPRWCCCNPHQRPRRAAETETSTMPGTSPRTSVSTVGSQALAPS